MSSGAAMTPRQVVATLEAIGRTRALSEIESLALEKALGQLALTAEPMPAPRPWPPHEDQLLRLVMPKMARGRPRRDAEIRRPTAILAKVLERTPKAIESRARKLRRIEAE